MEIEMVKFRIKGESEQYILTEINEHCGTVNGVLVNDGDTIKLADVTNKGQRRRVVCKIADVEFVDKDV